MDLPLYDKWRGKDQVVPCNGLFPQATEVVSPGLLHVHVYIKGLVILTVSFCNVYSQ